MQLWRISRHRDLSGTGGIRASARWHHAGRPIVYLSESPASALLEVCVHTAASDIPPEFTLMRIEAPDQGEPFPHSIDPAKLPANWQENQDVTRDIGSNWLKSYVSALLRVPSAIVPHTVNYLFNPVHPDAPLFRIAEAQSYPFDHRLKI